MSEYPKIEINLPDAYRLSPECRSGGPALYMPDSKAWLFKGRGNPLGIQLFAEIFGSWPIKYNSDPVMVEFPRNTSAVDIRRFVDLIEEQVPAPHISPKPTNQEEPIVKEEIRTNMLTKLKHLLGWN